MKKKINASSASFERLITDSCLYVDKTKYIYDIITSGNTYFFLSRPRRFGKTLTVSTLENIFKGKKELFKDLYIGKTDYDFMEYPIIHIDFGLSEDDNAQSFSIWLNRKIISIGESYGICLPEKNYAKENLASLLQELSKKEKVVVLVDEYDKPISSSITQKDGDPEGIRDVLRGFFEVLKASYDYVRFVFITGVTKYAKTSVFSTMNNLIDISMSEDYATMLGYTQKELEDNFSEYIEEGMKNTKLSRKAYLKKLKEKYDGYCFYPGSETVYNPVSIGSFFSLGKGKNFDNYWIETGGSILLSNLARKSHFNVDLDLGTSISQDAVKSYDIIEMVKTDINKSTYKAFLFQAGYLTIKNAKKYGTTYALYLDYPNNEVREAFSTLLVNDVYSGKERGCQFEYVNLLAPLYENDTDGFITALKSVYASVPYTLENGNKNIEADFHLMFHCMLTALGASINSEVLTNKGRLDSVIELPKDIYIFEFKVDKTPEEAISQIRENSYYEQYVSRKKQIHLIGISFSSTERNVVDYKEETLTK